MMPHVSTVLLLAALASSGVVHAQTRVRLATIIPGTEKVQLVQNGDFQFQGPEVTNSHPNPTGWSRQAEMFVGTGTNTVLLNGDSVAFARVNAGSPAAGLYTRTVRLEPNTAYVLSAYLWNFGNAANRVTTVIDLADAFNEPQITLSYSDTSADQGYFVYRSFNTTDTGTNITLRIFYDGLTGSGASPAYAPLGAQWDNIAITKATDFQAPLPSGSGANLRPLVTITSPGDGQNLFIETVPAGLPITASASDFDGTITNITFHTGTTRLGETASSPYMFLWPNVATGAYQLTAIATDNAGATTLSAPVGIAVSVVAPQQVPLQIAQAGTNVMLSWSTSATAAALQARPNLTPTNPWRVVTHAPALSGHQNIVTVPGTNAQQLFRLGDDVDATTMDRKLLMGYQGWFGCPQDGSPANRWIHWFRSQTPVATNATVDFWPDVSELDDDELFATSMTLPDGSPAKLYSAYKQKTVVRHFGWMKDHHVDGVFLQRFTSELGNGTMFAVRNQVAANVRLGADTYGRVFAIMYDISGQSAATLVSTLTNDWNYLTGTMHLTNSPRYLRHKGKPVVAIWGFGFTDRPGTPQDATNVIAWFKAAGCTVMGGVPTHWRTLTGDSQTNAAWAVAYRAFDVLSPWAVGRYSSLTGADNFKNNQIVPDFAACNTAGIEYMPVVFPGFSWTNLNKGPFNQIPRNGGTFYWRQVYNALSAGCTMIYGAMFDEVDEGTAMFKLAPTAAELPAQGSFVPLNVDGYALPSDWYLRLADQAGRMLRGEIPLRSTIPITPP